MSGLVLDNRALRRSKQSKTKQQLRESPPARRLKTNSLNAEPWMAVRRSVDVGNRSCVAFSLRPSFRKASYLLLRPLTAAKLWPQRVSKRVKRTPPSRLPSPVKPEVLGFNQRYKSCLSDTIQIKYFRITCLNSCIGIPSDKADADFHYKLI